MAEALVPFDTYTRSIWNNKPPDYAYFCWRWDEKLRLEGNRYLYTGTGDPVENNDFVDGMLF